MKMFHVKHSDGIKVNCACAREGALGYDPLTEGQNEIK